MVMFPFQTALTHHLQDLRNRSLNQPSVGG